MSFPPNYPPPPPMDGGYGQPPFQQPIPNYMWQAVVVTVLGFVCCCFGVVSLVSAGFGIAALVMGSQVAEKQRAGDIEGAYAVSKRIRTFVIVAAVFLGISLIVSIIWFFAVSSDFYWNTNY